MATGDLLGNVHVDMSMLPLMLMDGSRLLTWKGEEEGTSDDAVLADYEDFRAYMFEIDGGFAWAHGYLDTGSLGTEWDAEPVKSKMGELLATAAAHATESLGKVKVTSGTIGLVSQNATTTHLGASDVAAGAKAPHRTAAMLGGAEFGSALFIPVPNGTYEITREQLSDGPGPFEHPELGEVHARYRCLRVGD